MNPETQKRVVLFLKTAAPVLETLLKRAAQQEAEQQKVANTIPGVVNALVEAELIPETKRAEAMAALANPVSALETLANFAKYRKSAADVTKMGQPTNDKQANANGAGEKKSDDLWFKRLGVR